MTSILNKTSHMHTSCICPRKRMKIKLYYLPIEFLDTCILAETTQGRIDSPRKLAETTHLPRPKRPNPKIGRNDTGRNDPGPKRPPSGNNKDHQAEAGGEVRVRSNWFKPASNFKLLIVPMRYFCGGSYCFMSWCLNFCAVKFAPYVCFHNLVKFW